jgi:hypothetical protein
MRTIGQQMATARQDAALPPARKFVQDGSRMDAVLHHDTFSQSAR